MTLTKNPTAQPTPIPISTPTSGRTMTTMTTTIDSRSYETPAGPLTVLAERRDGQLVVVAAGFCSADQLWDRVPAAHRAPLRPVDGLGPIDDAMRDYLAGDLHALEQVPIDQTGTDLQQEVWQALRTVPVGETRTYGELARLTTKPNAVRAVASACGRNLIAPFIPCHRVLRGDGSIGGYHYGIEAKQWLLDHEASVD